MCDDQFTQKEAIQVNTLQSLTNLKRQSRLIGCQDLLSTLAVIFNLSSM